MTILVEQNILGLQVAIYYPLLMQTLNGKDDFTSVEPNSILIKSHFPTQMEKELPAIKKVNDHVQFFRSLEGVMHMDQKRAVDLL